MNKMKEIRLEKLTLNIGAGESGPKLEKSKALIEKIGGGKTVTTRTHKRTTFGGPKNRPIGIKATIRGTEAKELLKKLLNANDNKLKPSCFDDTGNFSFGIHEYINIPGIKYDPDIGIMGLDVAVTLERRGYRIKKRMLKPHKIGKHHRITKEDAQEFLKKEFDADIKSSDE